MSKMAINGHYEPLNESERQDKITSIKMCWEDYLDKIRNIRGAGLCGATISYDCDEFALGEIAERINKRKDYFKRYHSGMEMSEFKEIGLAMFWLTKFKPFSVSTKCVSDRLSFEINDDFVVYYMLSAIVNIAKEKQWNYSTKQLSPELYHEIVYSVCFRDLSKEALGLIVELVANIVIRDLPKKMEKLVEE